MKLTTAEFSRNIQVGAIPIGSVVLVKRGETAFISKLINWVQQAALRDIDILLTEEDIKKFAQYTHAGIVGTERLMYHMYHPYTCAWPWNELVGKTIIVLKPNHNMDRLCLVGDYALADVMAKLHYDYMDLFGFLIRWKTKILMKLKFYNVFGSRKKHVCSTKVIDWYNKAGITNVAQKDFWGYYPARFIVSDLFSIIEEVEFS
jgi:hypothetical protein